jgi:hypothetical protein
MDDDEIMAELRQIRAEMLEEFGNLEGLHQHLEAMEAEAARKGRLVVSLPPRRPEGYKPEAA